MPSDAPPASCFLSSLRLIKSGAQISRESPLQTHQITIPCDPVRDVGASVDDVQVALPRSGPGPTRARSLTCFTSLPYSGCHHELALFHTCIQVDTWGIGHWTHHASRSQEYKPHQIKAGSTELRLGALGGAGCPFDTFMASIARTLLPRTSIPPRVLRPPLRQYAPIIISTSGIPVQRGCRHLNVSDPKRVWTPSLHLGPLGIRAWPSKIASLMTNLQPFRYARYVGHNGAVDRSFFELSTSCTCQETL